MKAELVDARPHHCGQIARRLRRDHAAVLVRMGVSAHRDLRQRFDASAYRKAWLVDGKLMAVGGIEGPLGSGDGWGWMAFAEDIGLASNHVARMILRELDRAFLVKQSIRTFVLKDDEASLRFAYFLGFRAEKTEIRHGVPVMTMVAERQIRKVA